MFSSTVLGDISATASAFSYASAVIFFRLAGYSVGPIAFNVFKTTLAFALFVITLPLFAGPLPHLTASQWGMVTVSGFLGITIGDVLNVASLNRIGAGRMAIVGCLYAPFMVLIAFFLFGELLNLSGFVGLLLVVFAVLLTVREKSQTKENRKDIRLGILYGILGECLMGYSILMIRDLYREHSVLWIVAGRYLVGSLALIIWGVSTASRRELKKVFRPSRLMKYTVPSAVFGPFLATLLWFVGFKYTLAGRAAVFNQLSTFFILILATLVLKERLTPIRIVSIVLGFVGALVVSW